MKKNEIHTELKNYTQIRDHIEELLRHKVIDDHTRDEAILVFEAVYNDILAQGFPEDTVVQVWSTRPFGDTRIKIAFDGKTYVPASVAEAEQAEDYESIANAKVIDAFGEKIENRYHSGRNHLILTAKRSVLRQVKLNAFSVLLAALAYIPLMMLIQRTGQQELIGEYVYSFEKMFTDAVLGIGGPVTFFSLLRNLTSIVITVEGDLMMRRMEMRAIGTSIMSILLAILMCNLIRYPFAAMYNIVTFPMSGLIGDTSFGNMNLKLEESTFDIIDSFTNSNILSNFESFAPFPLIGIAILATHAMCSAGGYFESIRRVIDGCHVLFSKMLAAIMYVMPLFTFLAVLDIMLKAGRDAAVFMLCLAVFVPLSMSVMALFYSVRLKIAGVKLLPFAKNLLPLLKENLKISSTIEAVPFNIRYCVTKFGLNREGLNKSLPALSQVNLDGNCFIITMISIMFLFINGNGISTFDVVAIGVIIFFLSLGAPNQPGSVLIGLLVIISYLDAPDVISLAIFSEAMFGGLLSMTNAAGDIVTVVAAEQKTEKRPATRDNGNS